MTRAVLTMETAINGYRVRLKFAGVKSKCHWCNRRKRIAVLDRTGVFSKVQRFQICQSCAHASNLKTHWTDRP